MLIDAFAEFWDWLLEWYDYLPRYLQVSFGFVLPLVVFGASSFVTCKRVQQVSEALVVGLVISIFIVGIVGVEH